MVTSTAPETAPAKSRRVFVILNPASCRAKPDDTEAEIGAFVAEHNYEPEFFRTIEDIPATATVVAALERGFDLVVAAGGDGTIMEVANALIDADVPLGIIPLGTGNLLAFNLNIPFQIREALRVIVSDTERTIDIIRVNHGEHFFAIMGGIGFDAKVMDDTDRDSKHRFGRLAYLWTAVQNLEGELFEAILSMDDGEPESVRAKSILIANMGQLGPNVNAFPGVDPDSGIMQVGILKASHAADFARLVAKTVVDGSPADDPFFDVYSCRSLTVTLNSPQPFEYDGNVIGMVSDLTADVMPHALRVRIPNKS